MIKFKAENINGMYMRILFLSTCILLLTNICKVQTLRDSIISKAAAIENGNRLVEQIDPDQRSTCLLIL